MEFVAPAEAKKIIKKKLKSFWKKREKWLESRAGKAVTTTKYWQENFNVDNYAEYKEKYATPFPESQLPFKDLGTCYNTAITIRKSYADMEQPPTPIHITLTQTQIDEINGYYRVAMYKKEKASTLIDNLPVAKNLISSQTVQQAQVKGVVIEPSNTRSIHIELEQKLQENKESNDWNNILKYWKRVLHFPMNRQPYDCPTIQFSTLRYDGTLTGKCVRESLFWYTYTKAWCPWDSKDRPMFNVTSARTAWQKILIFDGKSSKTPIFFKKVKVVDKYLSKLAQEKIGSKWLRVVNDLPEVLANNYWLIRGMEEIMEQGLRQVAAWSEPYDCERKTDKVKWMKVLKEVLRSKLAIKRGSCLPAIKFMAECAKMIGAMFQNQHDKKGARFICEAVQAMLSVLNQCDLGLFKDLCGAMTMDICIANFSNIQDQKERYKAKHEAETKMNAIFDAIDCIAGAMYALGTMAEINIKMLLQFDKLEQAWLGCFVTIICSILNSMDHIEKHLESVMGWIDNTVKQDIDHLFCKLKFIFNPYVCLEDQYV